MFNYAVVLCQRRGGGEGKKLRHNPNLMFLLYFSCTRIIKTVKYFVSLRMQDGDHSIHQSRKKFGCTAKVLTLAAN